MYDTKTNPSDFVKLNNLRVGDRVSVDGGFTCIPGGTTLTVVQDSGGQLCVPCAHGLHPLSGQVDDENDVCVGVYRIAG